MNDRNSSGYFFFKIQVIVSFVILETLLWNAAALAKEMFLERFIPELHQWAAIFFHPVKSHLLNYLSVCIVAGVCGGTVYFLINDRIIEWIRRRTCPNKSMVVIILILSVIILPLPLFLPTMQVISIYSVIILLPLVYLHAS